MFSPPLGDAAVSYDPSFLAEASTLLSSSLDAATILRNLAELVVPALADACLVHTAAEDGLVTPMVVVHRDPARRAAQEEVARLPPRAWPGDTAIQRVLVSGVGELHPVVTDSFGGPLAGEDLELAGLLAGLGTRSLMVVPLAGRARVFAALSFIGEDPARYGPADLARATDLARRAALAVENARLYAEEQRARRAAERAAARVSRLQQLTEALAATTTLEDAEQAVVEGCRAAIGAAAGFVWLLDERGESLWLAAHAGFELPALQRFRRVARGERMPITDALRGGQPIVVRDRAALRAGWPDMQAQGPHRAWLALPLTLRGAALGAISLSFDGERDFDDDDRAFVVTLAGQCAQAIERGRAFAAERESRVLADLVPSIVWTARPEGTITWFNRRWEELTGVPLPDPTRWGEHVHPDDIAATGEAWRDAVAQGAPYEHVFRLRTPAGYRWFLGRAEPLRDAHGGIVKWIGTTLDIHDKEVAAEALRTAERRLRTIMDSATAAIYLNDLDGRTIVANSAYEEIVGPALAARFRDEDRRVAATGAPLALEQTFELAGETHHLYTVKFPVRDAAGRLYAVGGISTDITPRKRAERALRDSEERLRLAMAAAQMGSWHVDLDTGRATRDASLQALFGLPPVEIVDDPAGFFARVHPEDRERVRAAYQALVEGRGAYDVELRFQRADGTLRWARDRGALLRDAGGRATAVTGVLMDVTELKVAEERAREEGRLAETLHRVAAAFGRELDHQRLVQLITDEATVLTGARTGAFFFNVTGAGGEAYQLFTLSGADIEVYKGFRMPRATPIFAPTFRGDGTIRLDDVREDPRYGRWGPQPKGHPTVVSYLAAPVRAPTGEVLGGLFLAHPERGRFSEQHERMIEGLASHAGVALENARLLRELRRREEELTVAVEQARAADRRKDEFLAMLGHELRNPLAPISTAVQLMRLRDREHDTREAAIIERQVAHLSRLVDDLLDVSRIKRGTLPIERQRLELATALVKAVETVSALVERHGHELTLDVPHAGLVVDADPVRLAQVFQNLLTNAAKYTDRGGRIEVRAWREGGEVVATVRDDGIGIAPELLPRMFELFVQGPRAIDRAEGGLGIGLTLVESIVAAHGGTVAARSEGPGRGATFEVRLPAVLGAAPRAEVDRRGPDARRARRGQRVLIVDDNVDAATVLGEALDEVGYDVMLAHDAEAALALARGTRPDVALLDIGLPVMDGWTLGRRLRELCGPALRVLAVTGYGQEQDRDRSRDAGFAAHLVKPVDLEALVALLEA